MLQINTNKMYRSILFLYLQIDTLVKYIAAKRHGKIAIIFIATKA